MKTLVLAVLLASFPGAAEPEAHERARLGQWAEEIRRADYRGDREELRRLSVTCAEPSDPALARYHGYWRGFARWRRAINGFSETPLPEDLGADLESAVADFKSALARDPGWIEAKIGLVGSSGNLLWLARDDPERRNRILEEYRPMARELQEVGAANPRALWLIGGMQLSAPPPWGGDFVKAAATLRRGLEAARSEALSEEPEALAPRWGAAELLMNLAYLHSHGAAPERALALAYAEGALAMVPDWHYVKDVLLPQVEALPRPGS